MGNNAQTAAVQAQKNRDFMRLAAVQAITANAQNGTTYNLGQLMNFDVPIVPGGMAHHVRIYYTLNFTYTPAGSGPYVNVTAGGAYNIFQDVSVNFGNKQITMHPYISKVLDQIRGYNRTAPGTVLGNSSASVQSLLYSQPAVSSGANTWKGYIDVPLTSIHPTSIYGAIPISGSGTRMQVQLTPASALAAANADPLQYALSTNGTISAVSGTVTVVIKYRDFRSFATPQALSCDLSGLPTAQIIKLREINPLTAGSVGYASITNPYPFSKIISILVDGNSSTSFSSASNIQQFRIDGAENTSSALRVYDQTTGGMLPYYSRVRELYGQDLDDGVLIFDANAENTADSSLQEGEMWLNVASSGYPAARLGVQVNSVSSTNFTPRLVSYGVLLNPIGIN